MGHRSFFFRKVITPTHVLCDTCLYLQQVSSGDSPRSHKPLQPLPRVSLFKQRWQDNLKQKQLKGQFTHWSITRQRQRAIIYNVHSISHKDRIILNLMGCQPTPLRAEWTHCLYHLSSVLSWAKKASPSNPPKTVPGKGTNDLHGVKSNGQVLVLTSLAILVAHYMTGHFSLLKTPPWTSFQDSWVPLSSWPRFSRRLWRKGNGVKDGL